MTYGTDRDGTVLIELKMSRGEVEPSLLIGKGKVEKESNKG